MSTLYNDYIGRLSKRIEARLADIEAVFNFDLGDEYEIALCQLLADVLPEKYGICRGFVLSADSKTAGDDIIIYDRMSHPTIRSKVGVGFARKDQVPIEAVYAYIECKHTLQTSGQSGLPHAIEQVRKVKELVYERQPKRFTGYLEQPRGRRGDWPHYYPSLKNQPFGMVFARRAGDEVTVQFVNDLKIGYNKGTPDFMVLGSNIIASPTIALGPDGFKSAMFYDSADQIPLLAEKREGCAAALGIVTLLHALNWIELLDVPWANVLNQVHWQALSSQAG